LPRLHPCALMCARVAGGDACAACTSFPIAQTKPASSRAIAVTATVSL
jgi:hypothetical protein